MMQECMAAIYGYAIPAVYWDAKDERLPCHVFLDTGWQDEIRGYESQAAFQQTLVSVQLKEIPHSQKGDRLYINDVFYTVLSVQAQDDVIAVLYVQKHD